MRFETGCHAVVMWLPCLSEFKTGVPYYQYIAKVKEYEFDVVIPDNIVDIVELDYESLNTFLGSCKLFLQNPLGSTTTHNLPIIFCTVTIFHVLYLNINFILQKN